MKARLMPQPMLINQAAALNPNSLFVDSSFMGFMDEISTGN
jgi:hypothetical protein